MSLQSFIFNYKCTRSDSKRDAAIPLPENVTECRNISYGSNGKWSLLDVYYPEGTTSALPTIVSIHGGGYVYGTKEIYRRYGMDLASRGFAFVNFNYRLAPKYRFPAPLVDTNAVMDWICKNAARYHLDPQRIILVGDSAGAQLASQYVAIWANKDYAAHFDMKLPKIKLCALGLNCGMYDLESASKKPLTGFFRDYLSKDYSEDDPRLKVLAAINESYPPAYITTACHDFLRGNAEPMWELLRSRGVTSQWKCYGSEEDENVAHVFHVNIMLPEAKQCNDDSAAFFRLFI